jgi:integrase
MVTLTSAATFCATLPRRLASFNIALRLTTTFFASGFDTAMAEIVRVLDHAADQRSHAMIMTAAFTGLRASELRGLTWEHVDLGRGLVKVCQRADRYSEIGAPKSAAGDREVPMPGQFVEVLRQWKLASPHSRDRDFVFGNGAGNVENHSSTMQRCYDPAQVAAGVVDDEGKPKYNWHALRHFFASWCINRRVDGGLELPAKVVQTRMGHSSIVMTLDRRRARSLASSRSTRRRISYR